MSDEQVGCMCAVGGSKRALGRTLFSQLAIGNTPVRIGLRFLAANGSREPSSRGREGGGATVFTDRAGVRGEHMTDSDCQ